MSDEEHTLIVLEFETFTRMKEDAREKCKMSLEKSGNSETEANELLRRNKTGMPASDRVQNYVQNHVQNRVLNRVQNNDENRAQNHVQNRAQNHVQNRAQNHV